MRLRILDGGQRSAIGCQALWHGVGEAMRPEDDPALVFVTPTEPHVCVGYHQNADVEVDLAACHAAGVSVLRRRLGGGAVLLDSRQLIFHYVWPRQRAPRQLALLYPQFLAPLVEAYRAIGVPAAYRAMNDVHVAGRKIAGAAAAEIGQTAVVGSMVLFDFDGALMARLLRVPDAKMRDKLAVALGDYVTSLRRLLPAPPDRAEMMALLVRQSAKLFEVQPEASEATAAERRAADSEARRLSDPAWTRRPGRKFVTDGAKLAAGAYLVRGQHKAPGGLVRVYLLARDGRIAGLDITGDFTCSRPEAVGDLTRQLEGLAPNDPALPDVIATAIKALDLDMPGVAPLDIAAAIRDAERDGC
jgi:lipoate---protein ligase